MNRAERVEALKHLRLFDSGFFIPEYSEYRGFVHNGGEVSDEYALVMLRQYCVKALHAQMFLGRMLGDPPVDIAKEAEEKMRLVQVLPNYGISPVGIREFLRRSNETAEDILVSHDEPDDSL